MPGLRNKTIQDEFLPRELHTLHRYRYEIIRHPYPYAATTMLLRFPNEARKLPNMSSPCTCTCLSCAV